MNQIIDWEAKGHLIRFYLGENGNQEGPQWSNKAYEHNASRVDEEYIKGFRDLCFPFDDRVVEPGDFYSNSPYRKYDFVNRIVPFLLVIPNEIWNEHDISYSGNYIAVSKIPGIKKFYFGDVL